MNNSAISLILNAGLVVKGVLLLLLTFSVISWGIIIFKWRYFAKAEKESEYFSQLFRTGKDPAGIYRYAKSCNISPLANLFKSVYTEGDMSDQEGVGRSLRRYGTLETAKLERYLSFLATTGSTAPFIGLFGTVWGIMDSFHGIGAAGSASLAVVAPGIAEALIATAVGLVTAIPAVIGYNYFLSAARRLTLQMDDFSQDVLAYFQRLFVESRQR